MKQLKKLTIFILLFNSCSTTESYTKPNVKFWLLDNAGMATDGSSNIPVSSMQNFVCMSNEDSLSLFLYLKKGCKK